MGSIVTIAPSPSLGSQRCEITSQSSNAHTLAVAGSSRHGTAHIAGMSSTTISAVSSLGIASALIYIAESLTSCARDAEFMKPSDRPLEIDHRRRATVASFELFHTLFNLGGY